MPTFSDMARPIYLIGFPGSGKSTIGKRLAHKFGKRFIDLDAYAVQSKGFSDVSSYVSAHFMTSFRRVEANALKAVSEMSDVLIACGGAIPCFKANWRIMKDSGSIVYLEERSEDVLLERLYLERDSRPALRNLSPDGIRKWIRQKQSERVPIYEQADVIIPANGL